jgi:hypothetical protein
LGSTIAGSWPRAAGIDINNSSKGGRAILYPIYKGSYERRVNDILPGTSQELEYLTQRFKDLGRSVDYLKTRTDIDKNEQFGKRRNKEEEEKTEKWKKSLDTHRPFHGRH